MGFERHHAMIVTYCDFDNKGQNHPLFLHAKKLGGALIGPSEPQMNGVCTFCLVPDGSKNGWEDSQKGDDRREKLARYLRGKNCDWVVVEFGGDGAEALIADEKF